MSEFGAADLERIYRHRFDRLQAYRRKVWALLVADFFQAMVGPGDAVLDLGCGYGEFITQVNCGMRYAMDLNPAVPALLGPGVQCLIQDCSARWPLDDGSLDRVFTSNFLEHLADKSAVGRTLDEAYRCLKAGGRIVALGPNIRHLPGEYWDFWDHFVPLTERSLSEALTCRGFRIKTCMDRFLPATMARGSQPPLWCLRLYLRMPWAWRFLGRQFLVVGEKPS